MEDKMLRELIALTRENNEILRSINMQRRWGNFFWAFKWLLIFALLYSAYRAASPYISQAQDTYNQAQSTLNSLNSLGQQAGAVQNIDQKSFNEFIQEQIKKRMGQ